jgi:hypothetical protein
MKKRIVLGLLFCAALVAAQFIFAPVTNGPVTVLVRFSAPPPGLPGMRMYVEKPSYMVLLKTTTPGVDALRVDLEYEDQGVVRYASGQGDTYKADFGDGAVADGLLAQVTVPLPAWDAKVTKVTVREIRLGPAYSF